MTAPDPLADARAALARYEWEPARSAATAVGPVSDLVAEADRLDLIAEADWWLGDLGDCIEHRERAYLLAEQADDRRRAAQVAVWLYEHHCFQARPAVAGAWLRRARHLVGDDPECVEHGALLLREAEAAHGGGDLEAASGAAREVVELGRRLRSADLEAEALQTLGRVLIDAGDPAEGLATIDEAMLFAAEGRLRPYSTGKVYCSLISACEALGDVRRAAEWSEMTARWAQRHPLAVFPGLCRVHVATALRTRGQWQEAEVEARRACAELASLHVANAAAGHAEIGEIRRRLGDLAGAEEEFGIAEALNGHPHPGLAMVRLAQGNVTAADAIVAGALEDLTWDRLGRGRLLPGRAQISIASGDLAAATDAVEELEAIAAEYGSPSLTAAAATARGRLELATGDGSACATLRRAAELWHALGVPHEVATARMLQGVACRDGGDLDGAADALGAAGALFEELGAADDLRSVRDLTGGPTAAPAGLTEREVEVLGHVAAGLTNKQIAAELFLSDKTVARHLSNIFTKTGVTSRSAATAFAYAHGLVD
jgi:ATP/maltotriose-dependent transcriptional regulator MalT